MAGPDAADRSGPVLVARATVAIAVHRAFGPLDDVVAVGERLGLSVTVWAE